MKDEEYQKQLRKLQAELVALQEWVKRTGQRIVIVFEGRDTAGKGGLIRAITERVSARVFRIVALPSPSDRERSQLYLQRYIQHFPAAGEIVLFDRSWYNRAGVEPVMGFCTPQEAEMFLEVAPLFERELERSGIKLLKYWLEVGIKEQEKRLLSRIENPAKQWKLSDIDLEGRRRWYAYSRARDRMLEATDTDYSPWYIVDFEDQPRGRLNCIDHILQQFPYEPLGTTVAHLPEPDPQDAYDDRASLKGRRWVKDHF